MSSSFGTARIMIVDDALPNVELLEQILRDAGFLHIAGVTDSRRALSTFLDFRPDMILLDVMMPHLDGFAVMKQLRPRIPEGTFLPILVLTANPSPEVRLRALSSGASDFLTKPFSSSEVLLRITNLLATRALQMQLREQKDALEQAMQERTRALEESHTEMLERLTMLVDLHAEFTGQSGQKVGDWAAATARVLGLPDAEAECIRRTTPLRDIGKICIPDQILLKPGRLTPEEYEVVRGHTVLGAKVLSGSRNKLLQMAEEIALTHHEHWDGSGYTPGFAGEAIPLAGRIVAVVDAFATMLSDRPYRPALSRDEAISELERQSGSKFDPAVVKAFLSVLGQPDPVPEPPAPAKAPPDPVSPAPATSPTPSPESLAEFLTPREQEVLQLVAEGLSNRDIAARLFLSEATVKTHVSRVLQKMALTDRTKAAVYFLRKR